MCCCNALRIALSALETCHRGIHRIRRRMLVCAGVPVYVCVCVCVSVCGGGGGWARSVDKILHFTNTLLLVTISIIIEVGHVYSAVFVCVRRICYVLILFILY